MATPLDVTVFYLEMRQPNQRIVPAPRARLSVQHVASPTVPFYRELYHAVGKDYHWFSRGKLSDEALSAIISDPRDEMHVLYVDDAPAGFAELDRRQPHEIELVQFGLTGPYIGQGLGKWLLQWTVDKAWSYQPERFWLHTCTLDHAAAVPNYLKAGFVEYRRETMWREV